NRQRDDQCAPDVTKKEKKDNDDENDAFCKVMEDCMGGISHEVTSIDEWNDFDTRRKYPLVELLHFFMESFERLFRVCTLPHGDPSRNNVVVVDNFSVLAMNGSGKLA